MDDFMKDEAQARVVDAIDGRSVSTLARELGSPLFVFSERTLRARLARVRAAFTSRYPRVRFAWSYKTNPLDAICGIFHQEGWQAEVVSEVEYEMARRLGVPGPAIICNGANKSYSWCERALVEGAFLQIDHHDELCLVSSVAMTLGRRAQVGIRVNMALASQDPTWEHFESLARGWDRFGFNLDSGEALDAALRACESPSLQLSGLHAHVGTFITDPDVYGEVVRRLGSLAQDISEKTGRTIDRINIGGGFPSDNALLTGVNVADRDLPEIDAFADTVCGELKRVFAGRPSLPELVLESGRAMVDSAGSLIATVVGTRRLQGGKRGIVLDAGINAIGTARRFLHPVLPAQPVAGALEETDVHGPLCMHVDCLRRGVPLPPLLAGHHVVIRPVGAYNVSHWMQFSQLRPAVAIVDMEGGVQIIRRREVLDDIKSAELLPSRYAVSRERVHGSVVSSERDV